jgi:hypothetical protein
MASYKIYYLDFCHKNHPFIETKRLAELQNATNKPCFIEKVILPPKWTV